MLNTINFRYKTIRPARVALGFVALLGVLAGTLWVTTGQASAQPPYPIIYSGQAFIGGQPAPDGTIITGRISNSESRPVEVKDGKYILLVVDPSLEFEHGQDVAGLVITFFADGVRAVETDVYVEGTFIEKDLDLHFPELPLTGDDSFGLLWPITAALGAMSLLLGAGILAWKPRRKQTG